VVEVESPFYGDRPPRSPAGNCPGLWRFEVVEVFLCGPDARYLEIELGPWGHYWSLEFHGVRRAVRRDLPVDYEARIQGGRFAGRARLEAGWLPAGPLRGNAFAIHAGKCANPGVGRAGRCHHAWSAVPGERPDFHRIASFPELSLVRSVG
jgi:hypothetical protein